MQDCRVRVHRQVSQCRWFVVMLLRRCPVLVSFLCFWPHPVATHTPDGNKDVTMLHEAGASTQCINAAQHAPVCITCPKTGTIVSRHTLSTYQFVATALLETASRNRSAKSFPLPCSSHPHPHKSWKTGSCSCTQHAAFPIVVVEEW